MKNLILVLLATMSFGQSVLAQEGEPMGYKCTLTFDSDHPYVYPTHVSGHILLPEDYPNYADKNQLTLEFQNVEKTVSATIVLDNYHTRRGSGVETLFQVKLHPKGEPQSHLKVFYEIIDSGFQYDSGNFVPEYPKESSKLTHEITNHFVTVTYSVTCSLL